MSDLTLNYQSDFNTILNMIADARQKAAYQVNVPNHLVQPYGRQILQSPNKGQSL